MTRDGSKDWILAAAGCTAIIALLMTQCVDTVAAQKKKPDPVYTAHYYDRHMAFRKSTPTQEQMDHLHSLLTVMSVKNATGEVPDGSE